MHSSRFRVQVFDIDPWSELTALATIRYFQQAASDASAAVGYDVEWYAQAGTVWIIRQTTLDRVTPAHYRDELEVRTWVSDIRRVRSLREYEVIRPRDGATIARGCTDWVFFDLARGRPTVPPVEMQAALMPNGVVTQPRAPFKLSAPPGAARTSGTVAFADLDNLAHVNNANYVNYAEQFLWNVLAERGWRIDPAATGDRLRLKQHRFEYHESALYGDVLESLVWCRQLDARSFIACQEIRRDSTRLVGAESTWEWAGNALPEDLRSAVEDLKS